ncbi:MAG TPA: hypothetical protein VJC18_02325, partial [bacterium]|nr:hypothetical protein [bacterium]
MSPSPSVAPALAFPLPQSIAYSALGLSPKALGLVKAGARAMGETINTQQAFRVVRDTFGLGKDIRTGYGREAHGVLMEKFFPGFTTFTRTVDVVHPVQVQIKDEADGDTTKIWVEGYGNVSVRHDGIDTPESNPSEKLSKVVNYIFAYLQEEHAIPDSDMTAAKAVIQARVVYLGKLAGLVNKAFMGWSEFVSLAPAYARVAGAAHLCDVLDYADKYGRVLGRFMAGMPGEQNDLFDGFITSEVYNVMKAGGMAERETYRQKLGPHSG